MVEEHELTVISCGIFREELEYLMKEKGFKGNVTFLDAALHVNYDKLKERLVDTMERLTQEGKVLNIIYGNCHPEMSTILDRYGAKKIDAANCLEAIVGADKIRTLSSEAKTFFLTAGWVNSWKNMFELGGKDLHIDFKSMFTDYDRIVVFESEFIPIDEERLKEFRRYTGLPVERISITLEHFRNIVNNM
jgi:hypothetical protein